MPNKSDIRLGQLLVQKQLCSLRDVSHALSQQETLVEQGRRLSLGRLLVERGHLAEADLREALAELGALVLGCRACEQEYSVTEYQRDVEYTCHQCGERLELVETAGNRDDLVPYHSTANVRIHPATFDAAAMAGSPGSGESQEPQGCPAPPDPFVGKVLGGCKLLEKIAAGGMGVVYKAQQLNLNRLVAVKVLSRELSNDTSFVRRFIEEARSAAQLNHGNIVHINDVGDYQGIFYFTMEYVDGVNLKALLKEKQRLSVTHTLGIGLQVCRALQHAHHRGIIHRDIKPENIMITREGLVKLADLGLAKKLTPRGGEHLTHTGSILGTPFYMAPEQAKDFSRVDARSDIYSLGVTLYRAVAGQVPFEGRTPIEVMMRVIDGNRPALHELHRDLPEDAERIIDRMMEREPQDRYQTVDEVIADLTRVLDATAEKERSPTVTDGTG